MPSEHFPDVRFEIGHVLFIDIVGYSKLLITEQSAQLQTLKKIVRGTEQVQRAEAEGRLLRLPTGDGGALVFRTSPEAPMLCAMEIAKSLKNYPKLRVRKGIHSGPVNEISDLNEQANIAGAGINMAQRVMDCGDAGHILLSRHVAEDLEQYPRWQPQLQDLGECEVKHGARVHIFNLYADGVGNPEVPEKLLQAKAKEQTVPPVPASDGKPAGRSRAWIATLVIVAAAIAAAGFYIFSHRSGSKAPPLSTAPEKSIAVLPFENRSEDKANAYFADGIQDEILTRLSKIADLKVISRTSTQHYKSAPENLHEIAKQLGVANIVEGSVQKSGDSVRVNVQLIKAANDSHLWAETFDRKLTDIFSVESEVAKAIADQLRAKLTGKEEQVISNRPTENPQAYDAYLRGLAYTLKTTFSPSNLLNAQSNLKEAVRLDPKFARAWALLSNVEASGYITTFLQPTEALREEARRAAETALALQPDLGEGVLAKGYYFYACLKDYEMAERYLEQARALLPNSSQVSEILAYLSRRRGRWDRSESYFNQAEQLDPRNTRLLSEHAFSYIHLSRFREAQRKLDEILDITPDDLDTVIMKAQIAQAEGDLSRASAIFATLHPPANNTIALERQVYQSILERSPAPIIPRLKEILSRPDPSLGYFNGELRFWLGWAQAIAGEHDAAVESWRLARSELEPFLKEQPENHLLIGDLALVNMCLRDKAAALSLAERDLAVIPVEKDALAGPRSLEILARVAAGTGETDRAIVALEKLVSMPVSGHLNRSMPFTPALLRLDPMFDPLRNDPRFQKLCEEKPE
jgi:TolB-like protein/Tfp pilus assembly protein PilF/class 3 adenylate cyclase